MEINHIILILLTLITPYFILRLTQHFPFLNRIGAVVLAYAFGLIFALLFPHSNALAQVKDGLSSALIPLAIPLLLFQSDWSNLKGLAKKALLSLVTGILSVLLVVSVGFFLFRNDIPECWKVSGLLIGIYTGGTPNLASLKLLLDVNESTYLATHATDMIFSTIYFIFLLTIGQRVFDCFLTKSEGRTDNISNQTEESPDNPEQMLAIFHRENWMKNGILLGLSISILGVSYAFSHLFSSENQTPIIILSITTLGLLGSFLGKIKNNFKPYQLGMYLILSFCVVVASMIHWEKMTNLSNILFCYISFSIFGSLVLHLIIAKLFKIDTDTVVITSTALICSPPFVPVIAGALRNHKTIIPGLTIGIIGYAVGNYLGFFIAEYFRTF